MCNNWHKYTLRRQLLTAFGSITFSSLFLSGLICILFVVIFGETVKSQLMNDFLDRAKNDMVEIISSGGNSFDTKLSKATNNFPLPMAVTAEDSFRNDYPFGFIQSHYNWPDNFIGAKYNPDYSANVSFLHSSFNVYGKTLNEIPSLPTNMKNIIDKTANMDYLFRETFENSDDFFAGYIATPSRFLRYYPATVNDKKLNQYINYDNVGDYWYETVISNNDVTYTSPYYDPIAKALMITIGKQIRNIYTGFVIGAFGSDLVLKSIQNDVKNLIYLSKGRTLLLEKDSGYVIADSKNTITSLIQYSNIQNPSINSAQWELLKNNQQVLYEINNYYLVSSTMKTSNNKYMLVSIIDKEIVLNTFSAIIKAIDDIIYIEVIIVTCVTVLASICVLICAYCLTNKLIAPFENLNNIAIEMTKRLGTNTDEVSIEIGKSGIEEVDKFTEKFQEIVQKKYCVKEDIPKNEFYGQKLLSDSTLVSDPTKFPTPSAPAMAASSAVSEY